MASGVFFCKHMALYKTVAPYLFTNQEYCLPLAGDGLNQEVCACVVHVGHEDHEIIGDGVSRILIRWHLNQTNSKE